MKLSSALESLGCAGRRRDALRQYVAFHAAMRSAYEGFVSLLKGQCRALVCLIHFYMIPLPTSITYHATKIKYITGMSQLRLRGHISSVWRGET